MIFPCSSKSAIDPQDQHDPHAVFALTLIPLAFHKKFLLAHEVLWNKPACTGDQGKVATCPRRHHFSERRLPLRQPPAEQSFSASLRNMSPVSNDWVLPLFALQLFTSNLEADCTSEALAFILRRVQEQRCSMRRLTSNPGCIPEKFLLWHASCSKDHRHARKTQCKG